VSSNTLRLKHENTKPNQYLYNAGSELNAKTGSYEMYFRNYDPAIARMSGVDVMAESYASLTPYQYANNDPVYWNDPTGAWSSAYEKASAGGCGCWRDMGPQDGGGGGIDYNLATYGSLSAGGSAFGGSQYELNKDALAVQNGQMNYQQYGNKYGTRYELYERWKDWKTNGVDDGTDFLGYVWKASTSG